MKILLYLFCAVAKKHLGRFISVSNDYPLIYDRSGVVSLIDKYGAGETMIDLYKKEKTVYNLLSKNHDTSLKLLKAPDSPGYIYLYSPKNKDETKNIIFEKLQKNVYKLIINDKCLATNEDKSLFLSKCVDDDKNLLFRWEEESLNDRVKRKFEELGKNIKETFKKPFYKNK